MNAIYKEYTGNLAYCQAAGVPLKSTVCTNCDRVVQSTEIPPVCVCPFCEGLYRPRTGLRAFIASIFGEYPSEPRSDAPWVGVLK